jgi:cytosine/uracil/thiamine/allantoin permease
VSSPPLAARARAPQGILTVAAGNVVTLVPLVLNAHAGTKYGVPFPVLARASFGIKVPLASRVCV